MEETKNGGKFGWLRRFLDSILRVAFFLMCLLVGVFVLAWCLGSLLIAFFITVKIFGSLEVIACLFPLSLPMIWVICGALAYPVLWGVEYLSTLVGGKVP
jgi:hypothetical protein